MKIVRARSQRLQDRAFKLARSEDESFGDLCRNSQEVWVAMEDGEILACAGAELIQDHPCRAELTFCVVAKQARGRGLQERLLKVRLAWAEKEGVTCAETYTHKENKPSLLNLIKAGFVVFSFQDPFVSVRIQL